MLIYAKGAPLSLDLYSPKRLHGPAHDMSRAYVCAGIIVSSENELFEVECVKEFGARLCVHKRLEKEIISNNLTRDLHYTTGQV